MAIDLGAGTDAVDLLLLLPSGGGMSLLGAGLVGLFLANRALAPAMSAKAGNVFRLACKKTRL